MGFGHVGWKKCADPLKSLEYALRKDGLMDRRNFYTVAISELVLANEQDTLI